MTNNIYLTDINSSREHAQVEWRDGALVLKDLKSHNGTFVNGDKIEEQQIGAGDLIQIGENIFQIEGS
jgi:pSer/pThr/pTyr-binding forkhead associated (FHA) protein